MRYSATNAGLREELGDRALLCLTWQRLVALDRASESESAMAMVGHNRADPIRLFVKNELHKKEKVQQGRMRLIASVSVIDQLVERVLFGEQNKAEIERWETIPSKPGMGLHDEGLEALIRCMEAFERPVQTDVSGFDWSVKEWSLDDDMEVRLRLAGAKKHGTYHAVCTQRYRALSLALFVLSDGSVWEQLIPGIQKSGSYNTSSTNSRIRVMLAYIAGSKATIAMGDDNVEEFAEGAQKAYARMGYPLKEYVETTLVQGIGFCGHVFRAVVQQCEPERWSRLLANVLQVKPGTDLQAAEYTEQLRWNLRHSPVLGAVMSLLVRSGWGAAQTK